MKMLQTFKVLLSIEKIEILAMFEELPEGFHKQDGLKYLVRRINGQDNPTYANAWTGGDTAHLEGYGLTMDENN